MAPCDTGVLALKKKCCNPRILHAWRLLTSWQAMLGLQGLLSWLFLLAAGAVDHAGRRMGRRTLDFMNFRGRRLAPCGAL